MTLIDERELQSEQERKQKLIKRIISAIIVLVVIVVVLLVLRGILKNNTFKCIVDGDNRPEVSKNIMYRDKSGKVFVENGKVYISIRELSNTLGYQFYNSEYKKKGEDKSKCQVQTNNVYTSYIAGSNKIYRAIVTEPTEEEKKKANQSKNQNGFQEIEIQPKVEFEYFTVSDNIKFENEELYATIEAIQIGFDVNIQYDDKNNTLTIATLDYMEKIAKEKRTDCVPSSEYSYKNKRLLKYGMVVVRDSQGNYGIGSYTNADKLQSFVASCKYSSIDFSESTSTVANTINNGKKAGLLYINLENQETEKNIVSEYQDLRVMDDNFSYFLAKQNGKYGVINENGNTVIPLIFEDIGIKEEEYSDLTGKYILEDKYVPVKQNGKWGLYGLDGRKLIEPQYEEVGCNLAQNGDSVAFIPEIKNGVTGIVFLYNREKAFYGVYNADTGERIAISLTEVFKKEENGENNYYINYIIDRMTSKAHTLNARTQI